MYTASVPKATYWTLAVMGAGFLGGGLWALFGGDRELAIMGYSFVFVAAIFFVVSGTALVKKRSDEIVEATGIATTATVTGATGGGVMIDGVPQMTIHLQVRRANGAPPYEAKLKVLTFSPPAPGSVLNVRYDAKNPLKLVMDDAAPASSAAVRPRVVAAASIDASQTVQLLSELDRMRADGALTSEQFDAAKRKLLGQ